METRLAAFVMHWIVEDAKKGTITSRKPPGAAQLESALARCPGLGKHAFGNPGKRFAVACRQVSKLDGLQHRGSTDERIVNCPKCWELIKRQQASKEAV